MGHTDNGAVLTDAERDRAARLFRERYANGALTFAEFEAQLEALVSANTADELHALLHDQSVGRTPGAGGRR